MKILFITDNFPPELNAPATRTFEHCKEWVAKGEEVTVITCFPNFPQGILYEGYKQKLYQVEYISGIKVVRVLSYITANKGILKRMLDYVSFMMMASLAGIFIKTDIIIATSPQFFTSFTARFLSFIKRKKWVFEIRDIWPESIKVVAKMNDNLFIKVFEYFERSMYRSADKIVIVTHQLKTKLIKNHTLLESKIKVITNGVVLENFDPDYVNRDLKRNLGLENKFVIGYLGTHGMAHGLDFILKSLANFPNPEFHFIFIGDGAKKEELIALKNKLKLENVSMLPPVSKKEIVEYLSILDVGLVNLMKSDLFLAAIPSKIFELAAMGKPVLLGVDGEIKEIIHQYKAGIAFEPENESHFIASLLQIQKEHASLQEGCIDLARDFNRKKLASDMLSFLYE